jgi:hypothetical protein
MDAFTTWAVEQNSIFIDTDQFTAILTKGRGQTDSLLTVDRIHPKSPFAESLITTLTLEVRKGSHFIASSNLIFLSAGQKNRKGGARRPRLKIMKMD